jgi:hypothetical protein
MKQKQQTPKPNQKKKNVHMYIYLSIIQKLVQSRVSKGRDVPFSLCPGTKKILVPVSLCPGTRAGANVPGQNEFKNFKKKTRFPVFGHLFPVLEHLFPVLKQIFCSVLEHHIPVLEHPFLLCPILSRVPSRILAVPARLVPWQDF